MSRMTISSGIPALSKVSAESLPIDSEAISSPHAKSALKVLDAVSAGSVCPGSYQDETRTLYLHPLWARLVFEDLIGFRRSAGAVVRSGMNLKVSNTEQKFNRQHS
jgi:hypothetical protein